VASASDGKNVLLMNTQQRSGNWITVTLQGVSVNRMAVGSSVRITAGSRRQVRTVTAGNSYASQMSRTLHFGVGPFQKIDTLEIRWTNGSSQLFTDVAVNQRYQVTQNAPLLTTQRREPMSSPAPQFHLSQNFPNPFNPSTVVEFTIPSDGEIALEVFDLLGRKVRTVTEGRRSAGRYSERIDLSGSPSGMYLCRLRLSGTSIIRTMMLLR
jgi:hypothetical protein